MKSYLKIIAAMLIWSTWGPFIRWIDLPAVVVLFYTSLFAGVIVPLVLKYRGDFPQDMFSFQWWYLFVGLAVASISNNVTYFFALGHTTVSNAVFTHYTAPIFVAVLAPLLISERLERITLISLPVAVIGMAMIVFSNGGLDLESEHLPGILSGTASGVAYAFIVIFTRKVGHLHQNHKALVFLFWITTAVTAPFAFGGNYSIDAGKLFLLFLTGVFHSTMAPLLYFSALRSVLAQHAAILGYIEPLAAIPLAYLVLAEVPTWGALFGGILIIFSGYLVVHFRTAAKEE